MQILDRLSYQEVSKVTLDRLGTDGFCVWACDLLGGEKITIIRDRDVFPLDMRFSDPRREAASFPRFTVEELRTIKGDSDLMINRVYQVKKIFEGAEVIVEE